MGGGGGYTAESEKRERERARVSSWLPFEDGSINFDSINSTDDIQWGVDPLWRDE